MNAIKFLLVVAVFQFSVSTVFSQTEKISLTMKNATVREIMIEIERVANISFFLNDELPELNSVLDININKKPVYEALEEVLSDVGLTYSEIRKGFIVILPRSTENELSSGMITGTVVDAESGEPLPGVEVVIKGTNIGTISDVSGVYNITVDRNNVVLLFSYIGYVMQEVKVESRTIIDIALQADYLGIEEIVIIGYGKRKKKNLTGSISTIGEEILEKHPAASFQFALQGNTTGVRVIDAGGDPTAAPALYIRGVGTWQGSSQPLYVLDGQIITPPTDSNLDVLGGPNRSTPPNLWTLINPVDIESISVLKDASAAAIYGSRGANGVILITSRRGRSSEPLIEFSTYTGIQNIPRFEVLSTGQYKDIVYEMYSNNLNPDITIEKQLYGRNQAEDDVRLVSYSPQFDPLSPYYIGSDDTYDWMDELLRKNTLDKSYDIRLSGADENTRYYLSVGHKDQKSNFIGNNIQRYTVAVNVDTDAKEWLKTGLNFKFAHQKIDMNDYTDMPGLAEVAPWQPLRDENTVSGYAVVLDVDENNWQQRRIYGQGSRNNYLALSNLSRRDFTLQRHIGQGFVEISPLTGLLIRGSLNLDLSVQDRQLVNVYSNSIYMVEGRDPSTIAPNAPNAHGSFSSRVNEIYNYQSDLTITYEKDIGRHNIYLTGAVQDQFHVRLFKEMSGTNLLSVSNLDKVGFSSDQPNNNAILARYEKFWFSYLARVNYILADKYFIDFSYRRDGSSGFSEEYRWGNFFSLTGAWRISNETFMENLDLINSLKLRGGYGESGNDEAVVGSYDYLSSIIGAGSYRWGSHTGDPIGIYYPASRISDFPNPQLTWEIVKTAYAGVDAFLFKGKLNFTAEVYSRRTEGIQQYVNLPLSVGTNNPVFNIGVLENRGVDLMTGYNGQFGDWTFRFSGNISFLKNEVLEIYNSQPLYTNFGRVEEGRSIGHLWGYMVGGVFQTQDEIDAYYAGITDQTISNKDYVAPGDLYFLDIGGNPTEDEPFYSTIPDSLINVFDQTDLGNSIPGRIYGINMEIAWKNFDMSVSFYGEGDVYKYNSVRAKFESMDNTESNFWSTTLARYPLGKAGSEMPRAVIGDPAGNNRYSDRYVESAAFFRLNNWQLGYQIPEKIISKTGETIKSLRIYIGGQNNLYIYRWTGIDPVNDNKPLRRTILAGINVKF